MLAHRLTRRKCIEFTSNERHTLERVLTLKDLTFLGIACTLGSGTYIIAGQVARYPSGPAVIVSFLVAGFASVLAGLCYAEFGARVPKAGSAYIYSYVTVGELWAFIIGWNLILEYVIGTASIARAFTPYIDALFNDAPLSTFFKKYLPLHVPMFSEYVDLLAFGLCIFFTVLLCLGVKESTIINNIFTVVNVVIILYIMICGAFKADIHNWEVPESALPHDGNSTVSKFGKGGFFPYGPSGMFTGSATCFYAFVGFDVIATTGEEAINPEKSIPMSILLSLLTCAICYIGLSTVLTLMVPYYLLNESAPLPAAFTSVGWPVVTWIVAVGAMASFLTCLLTTMFPMPRIIFAMSRDGLLFRFLAHINRRFKTPDIATIVSGLLAGLMSMFFDLGELVSMMSIGTLLAYTLVAACVLILRYEYSANDYRQIQEGETSCLSRGQNPTKLSSLFVKISVVIISLITICLGLLEIFLIEYIEKGVWWSILAIVLPIAVIIGLVIFIAVQPQSSNQLAFTVPFVPVLPILSIMMNIYLMLKLNKDTWIRFAVWMFIGFLIYFGYGIRHGGDQTTVHGEMEVEPEDDRDAKKSDATDGASGSKCDENSPLLTNSHQC